MGSSLANNRDIEDKYRAYRFGGNKEKDLESLARAGERLVRYFVLSLTGGMGEDALQAGREGLLKAAVRFDPHKGVAFSTYAGHCVMGEIRHYIRKEASYYRPGRLAKLQSKVNRVMDEVWKKVGEGPSAEEMSRALNVKKEGITEVMRAGLVSLEEVDLAKIRNIRYESFRLPIEDRLLVEQAMEKLSEVQRKVIYLLFYMDLTQVETAAKLGINQRQVSRILHKSLQLMSKAMAF